MQNIKILFSILGCFYCFGDVRSRRIECCLIPNDIESVESIQIFEDIDEFDINCDVYTYNTDCTHWKKSNIFSIKEEQQKRDIEVRKTLDLQCPASSKRKCEQISLNDQLLPNKKNLSYGLQFLSKESDEEIPKNSDTYGDNESKRKYTLDTMYSGTDSGTEDDDYFEPTYANSNKHKAGLI